MAQSVLREARILPDMLNIPIYQVPGIHEISKHTDVFSAPVCSYTGETAATPAPPNNQNHSRHGGTETTVGIY